jgi:hypothetical protein
MNRTNHRRARDPQPDAVWLAAALREQAHQHEADSGRISARFEHLIAGERRAGEPRRAEPRRYSGPARLRLIGVPLGLLVLASATVTVAASLGLGNSPAAHPASKVATLPGAPGSTAATSGPGSLSASSVTLPAATTPPSATPARSATTATGPAGLLTAAGTVDPDSFQYWAQENLTVTTTRPLRELDVTVAVSGGPAVRSTGMWTTLLPADVETTVRSVPDGLIYDITLKAGQTLQPTAYKFGFQFNRPSAGHDFTRDTYRVSAVTTDGAAEFASGTF